MITAHVGRALAAGALLLAVALPAAHADGLDKAVGKALFDRIWVQAPSSTLANDGLGPLFNEKWTTNIALREVLSNIFEYERSFII